jgi:hypothetical protein
MLTTSALRTLTATYSGGGGFNPSSDTESQQVLPVATTTTITNVQSAPSLPGEPYNVFASTAANLPAAGTPVGSITINDGAGGQCTAGLSNGSMNCTITPIGSGVRTLSANYSGSSNFEASSGTREHTVKAATLLSIASVVSNPTPEGDTPSVTIAIEPESNLGAATGSVTISTDRESANCVIVLPQTSCNLALTHSGRHQIRAIYSGDDRYIAVNTTQLFFLGLFFDGFEAL